jgi:transposase
MQAAGTGYELSGELYMAMELSNRRWRLGFSNRSKIRQKSVEARDLKEVLKQIKYAKEKLGLDADARVVICFEAGRDGHWIHRWLSQAGFEVLEIDSSSIETARGRKHVKTDRVDVEKLLDLLMRYCHGYRRAFSVVRVPPKEAEASMRLNREADHLVKERTRVKNRLTSLLVLQGLTNVPLGKGFETWLESVRCVWDGEGLSQELVAELLRLHERYQLLGAQSKEVEKAYQEELSSGTSRVAEQRRRLQQLKAIGPKFSRTLSAEMFSWREFSNTKQVGGMSGLVPTPNQSGDSARDGGISKTSAGRLRATAIEMAWLWLRWQPDSELSLWFNERFANGGKRMRRVGIVALARKLLIALWKYLEHGEIPKGAVMSAP